MEFDPLACLRIFFCLSVGLIIGSFLNVVVIRLPRGQSLVKPRSRCVECKKPIRWWDNIPLVSYFILGGKCRQCGQEISIRYPVIEALTALLFIADAMRFGWSPAILIFRDWPFLALLISITFIDLEHRVIPDQLSIGGLILGIATCWLLPDFSLLESVGGAVLGFGIFYSLAWFYHKLRGRMGLGGGDIKLLAMLGAFLGPMGVLATICVSSIFGSVVGMVWARSSGKSGKADMMQFAIPFGPFLVVGALLYYFLGDLIWYLYTNRI